MSIGDGIETITTNVASDTSAVMIRMFGYSGSSWSGETYRKTFGEIILQKKTECQVVDSNGEEEGQLR